MTQRKNLTILSQDDVARSESVVEAASSAARAVREGGAPVVATGKIGRPAPINLPTLEISLESFDSLVSRARQG